MDISIKKIKTLLLVLFIFASSCLLVACGGDGNQKDDGNQTVQKYAINLSQEGLGTLTGAGTFEPGKQVSVSASPDAGYNFSGWYKDSTFISNANPYSFYMPSADLFLKAKFEPTNFLLTVNCNANRGTVERVYLSSSSYITTPQSITHGDTFRLAARANFGCSFDGWYEGEKLISSNWVDNFTMPAYDMTIEARFTLWPTILIDIIGEGSATGFGYREPGSTVTLEATAKKDWAFEGWYLDGVKVSSSATYYYTMPAHHVDFELRFVRTHYGLTVTQTGGPTSGEWKTYIRATGVASTGNSSITSSYKPGDSVTVGASYYDPYMFRKMVITINGVQTTVTTLTYTFTMPESDVSIVVEFYNRY